jgi:hypothetical protein
MDRDLLECLHAYFSKIETPTEEEKSILTQLTGELPFFTITHVSRDDLRSKGFDVTTVTDGDMEHLANEMQELYLNARFWFDMESIAMEQLDIPQQEDTACPACGSESVSFDFETGKHLCCSCDQKWGDSYVLVAHPEDSSHFENEDIGYPCFNSDDNGARYVPEYEYLRHFKKDPVPESMFRPVMWPDSQDYLEHTDERCEVVLADEKTLESFGSSAVWVPVEILNSQRP